MGHLVQLVCYAKRSFHVGRDRKESFDPRKAHFLNKLKQLNTEILVFSDEKGFDKDQRVKRRIEIWLCRYPIVVPNFMHSKTGAILMFLGVISNEGDVMSPHFFTQGLIVSATVY